MRSVLMRWLSGSRQPRRGVASWLAWVVHSIYARVRSGDLAGRNRNPAAARVGPTLD